MTFAIRTLTLCLSLAGSTAMAKTATPRPDLNLQPPSVIDPDLDPCRHFTADEPMVGFLIEMRLEETIVPMRVPKRYLEDRADHTEGAVHRAQLFTIKVPTFEPITPRELRGWTIESAPWDWMHFLVQDFRPLEETAGLQLLDNRIPFGDPRRIEQLTTPPDPRDFPSEAGPNGLTKVIDGGRRRPGEDVFVHYAPDGALDAWVRCNTGGVDGVMTGGCRHHARIADMDISISYRRTELPNWQMIQRNVTRFLTCATSGDL